MSDFGRELTRLMAERGVGVRQLARALYVNPGHVSSIRNGRANASPELAKALDEHLVRQPHFGL
jgi:transcriptional regulator with XRE-family HTH domain